jgi:hypothetical protein
LGSTGAETGAPPAVNAVGVAGETGAFGAFGSFGSEKGAAVEIGSDGVDRTGAEATGAAEAGAFGSTGAKAGAAIGTPPTVGAGGDGVDGATGFCIGGAEMDGTGSLVALLASVGNVGADALGKALGCIGLSCVGFEGRSFGSVAGRLFGLAFGLPVEPEVGRASCPRGIVLFA